MKITIISQHIFPIQTPRAHRTSELAKEFARMGHKVTVYAVLGKYDYSSFSKENKIQLHNIKLRWQVWPYTSDGDKRRHYLDKVLGKLFGKLFEFPNIEFFRAVPRLFKTMEKPDLLISIADPHKIHWGCAKAKIRYPDNFAKTWIADCGDPFMSNGQNNAHMSYFEKYERLFCEQCDFITVPVKEAINAYYPEYRNKIRVIPQGFDFNVSDIRNKDPENAVVSFAYAGTFYKDIRNPSLFLDVLSSLTTDFRFHVFTRHNELIAPYEKRLQEKLILHTPINRESLIEFLKSMDFLINLENVDRGCQVPSKLIDYAISGRPILSVSPSNPDKAIINEFLKKNYSQSFVIENIEQYQISNVALKFIQLCNRSDVHS